MSNAPQVIIQSPPPPVTELAPSEEGDIVPLDNDLVMEVYNMSYNELQKRIIQARKEHFLNGHTSLPFIRERVIVVDMRRNPNAIVEANLSFVGVMRPNN